MKRAWIALGILAAVFSAALYNSCCLRDLTQELTGLLACYAGLLDRPEKVTARELVRQFSWAKVPKNDVVVGCP